MTATDPSVPVSGSALPVQRRPIFQAAAILAIATAFPAMVGFEQYMIYSGCIALIWVLLATGYNIVIGMCGQLTMSHIAFYGIGAYTSSLLVRDVGVPFPLAFVAAIILPTIGAWIMAKAAVKFTAAYLAMITFAFHSMCWMLFVNWQPVTNGWEGVLRIPPASVFGYTFDTTGKVYYLLLVVAALGVVAAARIKNSRVGRAFFAIRDNRLAAKGVGINTQRTITLAFCLSGAYAGAAGSLMAHFVKYIDPTSFSLSPLIDLLVIVLIGGRGSVMGVAVAAVVFTFGLEYLRFLQDWRLMVFGALLLLLINFSPNGIGELGQRLKVRWIAYRSAK
jgi:branched-chain amino acid transport system permease protein